MIPLPPKLPQRNAMTTWLNKLRAYVESLTPRSGYGTMYEWTANGVSINVSRDYGAGFGSTGTVRYVPIAALSEDRVTVTIDSSTMDVAKPPGLRQTTVISGQYVTPAYALGDYIAIAKPRDGTGITGLDWIDLNIRGRTMRYPSRTVQVCVGLVKRYVDIECSDPRQTELP